MPTGHREGGRYYKVQKESFKIFCRAQTKTKVEGHLSSYKIIYLFKIEINSKTSIQMYAGLCFIPIGQEIQSWAFAYQNRIIRLKIHIVIQ